MYVCHKFNGQSLDTPISSSTSSFKDVKIQLDQLRWPWARKWSGRRNLHWLHPFLSLRQEYFHMRPKTSVKDIEKVLQKIQPRIVLKPLYGVTSRL